MLPVVEASPAPRTNQIQDLREQRAALIAYLPIKIKAADWHAVADCAMDLREVDAMLMVLGG